MKNPRQGFTLTEVLLVSAMFAVISLAVFNAFSNGFKLWARGQHVMVEGDTAMFLDRISEDVRQTILITGIPFKGNSTELSFPAIILGPTDNNGARASEGIGDQIGAVRYVYDPDQKKIFRYQATYGQALRTQWSEPFEVANLIEDVSLRYYYKAERGLNIKTQTDEDSIPMGIMIDVQFLDEGQTYHMRRFLIIPVGGGI
jgi:prepilin-type N-terminal cleavage/methylation domain-containing protein